MAVRKTEVRVCDWCENDIQADDELCLFGKAVPYLKTCNGKESWSFGRIDLCGECAKKLLRIRAEEKVMPTWE